MQSKNEVLLQEVDITSKVDFMDGYHHQVLIEYSQQEELSITLLDAAHTNLQKG